MKEMDDFEKNESIDDLIDIFGQAIDEMLVENEVRMQITLPEGSMDPEIKSTFSKTGPVLDFYILLHALKKVVSDFLDMDIIDPDKEEDMIDGMLQMVKDAIFKERQQDADSN